MRSTLNLWSLNEDQLIFETKHLVSIDGMKLVFKLGIDFGDFIKLKYIVAVLWPIWVLLTKFKHFSLNFQGIYTFEKSKFSWYLIFKASLDYSNFFTRKFNFQSLLWTLENKFNQGTSHIISSIESTHKRTNKFNETKDKKPKSHSKKDTAWLYIIRKHLKLHESVVCVIHSPSHYNDLR